MTDIARGVACVNSVYPTASIFSPVKYVQVFWKNVDGSASNTLLFSVS